jgi:hypothetical protein
MTERHRIDEFRESAKARCSHFEARYASGGIGNEYVRIAKRWYAALSRVEIDPNELRAIIAEAQPYQYRSDIAFFGFVNSMQSEYHELWEFYLSRNGESSNE